MPDTPPRWLLLIHQIPPKPGYLRVKVGRRLQGLGAVAVKNSVYVLPRSEQTLEDFQWVRREIVAGGGEGSVCEARFVEGLSDDAVEALFVAAREADYSALVKEAVRLHALAARRVAKRGDSGDKAGLAAALLRLRKRLATVVAIDHCGAPGREAAEGFLLAVEALLHPPEESETTPLATREVRGRTWVTRAGVHVDRIASAWLIRRFIDPDARFDFIADDRPPRDGELRFDMFEADFTHEGDSCTFEVLLRRFELTDPALQAIGELVHDIDLKDEKFSRPETPGVGGVIQGIALRHASDATRIEEGSRVFESLYEAFRSEG